METKAHDVHGNAAPRNPKMPEPTPENSVPLGTLKLRKRHEALRSATLDDVNRLGENVMTSSLDKLNRCTDFHLLRGVAGGVPDNASLHGGRTRHQRQAIA